MGKRFSSRPHLPRRHTASACGRERRSQRARAAAAHLGGWSAWCRAGLAAAPQDWEMRQGRLARPPASEVRPVSCIAGCKAHSPVRIAPSWRRCALHRNHFKPVQQQPGSRALPPMNNQEP